MASHLANLLFCSAMYHDQQEVPKAENWSFPVQISLFLKIIWHPEIWHFLTLVAWWERSTWILSSSASAYKSQVIAQCQHPPVVLHTQSSRSPPGKWLRKSVLRFCLFCCLLNRITLVCSHLSCIASAKWKWELFYSFCLLLVFSIVPLIVQQAISLKRLFEL